MRGRTPKPVNLSRLAGDRRAMSRNSLELPFAIPAPPDWLTEEAKAEWDELLPILARMRVISEADRIAIGQLADALSRWKAIGAMIKKYGYVHNVHNKQGTVVAFKRNPLVGMHIEYGLVVQKLLGQFGMTPSARARLTDDGKEETDFIFSRIAATQGD